LLALGTFVAGVHARAWRICLVGIVLAISLPVVAWIQDSAMLLLVGALMIAAIAGLFWWLRRQETRVL
jgi:LPXTG-motif cell wall-anchored protein